MNVEASPVAEVNSVVLAGGGTAGHVLPLLSLADCLRRRHPDMSIHVLGTATGLESSLVPNRGYPLHTIEKVAFPRKPNRSALRFPQAFTGTLARTRRIFREVNPQAVVGFGGYVATPAYLVGRSMGLPMVVHEQNARPGMANALGARLTTHVATTFPSTTLPHATCIGMPLRREVATLNRAALREEARRRWDLDPDAPTVLVTGGSLGAQSLNVAFERSVRELVRAGVQVLHATGRGKEFTPVDTSDLGDEWVPYVVIPYLNDMHLAYAACDLVVTRAGAGMVSELAAIGLPAIYVPLPIGNGEQRFNAHDVVQAGGGLLVDDASVSPTWVSDTVIPLVQDAAQLDTMSQAAAAFGTVHADVTLAQMVEQAVADAVVARRG